MMHNFVFTTHLEFHGDFVFGCCLEDFLMNDATEDRRLTDAYRWSGSPFYMVNSTVGRSIVILHVCHQQLQHHRPCQDRNNLKVTTADGMIT